MVAQDFWTGGIRMRYDVHAVKEKLVGRIDVIALNGSATPELVDEAALLYGALHSIEQVEKERDTAVDVILAVEDTIYAARTGSDSDEEWSTDRLSPLVNIAKIETALGRKQYDEFR